MLHGDRRVVAVRRVEHARPIAGLDAPDEPPHDARRGDLRFEAAGLAVVLAFDGVQREPRDRRGAPARAGHRRAGANHAADRVIAAREEDDVVYAARGADPRFGDGRGRPRRRDAVLRERAADAGGERGRRRRNRRGLGQRRRDPELARAVPRGDDAGYGAFGRRREIAVGRDDRARFDGAAVVDAHGDRARVYEL